MFDGKNSARIPALLAVLLLAAAASAQNARPADDGPPAGATLVWSDEFNGPEGSAPDSGKWTAIDDGSGFGNREAEYYTPRLKNVHVSHGNLVITALREDVTGKDGRPHDFTSGRIESRGKFEVAYGRIEARIKIPAGEGLWPAFWMLGHDFMNKGWPECGEIDIMENVGYEPEVVHGTLHGPGYSGMSPLGEAFRLKPPAKFADDFHVYAIEWEPGEIRFYVDHQLFETRRADALQAGQRWVFDHPFYILLNLAVGGNWPGYPNHTTPFPATMLVDYVRVYRLASKSK